MRWQSIFICAYLFVQIAAPLHYYTARRDKYDERFAWRMFSPERMVQCAYVFEVGDRTLTHRAGIKREFHEAWANVVIRARALVIEAMAAKLCDKYPGTPVKVRMQCHTVNKKVEHKGGGWNLCETKRL